MIFNRPWIVFLQFISTMLFSAVSWIRFGMALDLWDFLSDLPLSVSPLYPVVSGLLCGAAGLWVCAWIWMGHPRAPGALRILSVIFALYYWVDQVLVMTSELRQTNWVFTGLVTVVLLLLVFLSLKPAAVRDFFGEDYEQEKQN